MCFFSLLGMGEAKAVILPGNVESCLSLERGVLFALQLAAQRILCLFSQQKENRKRLQDKKGPGSWSASAPRISVSNLFCCTPPTPLPWGVRPSVSR